MIKVIRAVDWYVHLTMIVSMGLIIASFCVPPTGVIDGSVLGGVGEIGTMAAVFTFLAKLPQYIEAGAIAKISKGNTTIEVGIQKEDKTNENIIDHEEI